MAFLEAIKQQIWHLRKRVALELTQKLKVLKANEKLRKNVEVKDNIIIGLLKRMGAVSMSGKTAGDLSQDDLKLTFKSLYLQTSKKIDDINQVVKN